MEKLAQDGRPECMAILHLLPPYSLEDVKASYRDRAMACHPDRGGDPQEFHRLKQAYEEATHYLEVRGNLRAWIASRVESHMLQEEVVAEVLQRAGMVTYEHMDWVKKNLGEGFAHLEGRLRGIEIHGPGSGDPFLQYLGEHKSHVPFLLELDLSNSPLTDQYLQQLEGFQTLKKVNIANTQVTAKGVETILEAIRHLKWIDITGLSISWFGRFGLSRSYPDVKFVRQ